MEAEPKRRPGRPPNPDRQPTSRLELRVPPELRKRAYNAAVKADIPIGAYVQRALERELERDGE